MTDPLRRREPVRITITLDGGEVFNILTEGHDFGDLSRPFARAAILAVIGENLDAAILAANRRAGVHQPSCTYPTSGTCTCGANLPMPEDD